jgi:hypothetical protein
MGKLSGSKGGIRRFLNEPYLFSFLPDLVMVPKIVGVFLKK